MLTPLLKRLPVSLLLVVLLFVSQVCATTRLHKGPTNGQSERVLNGRTLSIPPSEAGEGSSSNSDSSGDTTRLVDFSIHIKKDVVIWNELVKDDIKFKSCWFNPTGRRSDITLAGKKLDVTDFDKNVVFAIEQEDLEINCKRVFEGAPGIDKTDNVLFYKILDVTVISSKKIELKMILVPGWDVVPLVELRVHEEPATSEAMSMDGFEIDDDDGEEEEGSSGTEIGQPMSARFLPGNNSLSTSAKLVSVNRWFEVTTGVSIYVDANVCGRVYNFKLTRLSGFRFEWEQKLEAQIKANLIVNVDYKNHKNGEALRRYIPGLSFQAGIPLVGKLQAGAFVGFDWFVELDASARSNLHIDATYQGHEAVTATLIPPRYTAVNKLPAGTGATSTSSLTYSGTAALRFQGFAGLRPKFGVGITYSRTRITFRRWKLRKYTERRSVDGNVGVKVGVDVQTALMYPGFPPYTGSGWKLGVCNECHHARSSLHFAAKHLSARLMVGDRIAAEGVLVEKVFNWRILTACLLRC